MIASAKHSGTPLNLTGRQLGRYEVLTQLASGGMASVYVARAQGVAGFERLVAIKVLHPHLAHEHDFITMFLDEARLAARIRHPNVVATQDISDTEGAGYFLVMDYVEGDHLGALLRECTRANELLPGNVVARILLDAIAGLSAAHELRDEQGRPLNLVHRDVSPHNILVGTDGVTRLTDFGVAKASVRLTTTQEGHFKGKLGYMAPEHASSGEADQRSDLFSMGIVLWESLLGRRLFNGENNAETLNLILNEPITLVSSFRPELEAFDPVIQRALARPREERFTSAEEFHSAVEAAAKASVGIANIREVGEIVRTFAEKKIADEDQRVREAMDSSGRSDLGEAPMPMPGPDSASHVRGPVDPEAATLGARPSTVPPKPTEDAVASTQRRPARLLLYVAVAMAALGLLWFVLATSGSLDTRPEPNGQPGPAAGPQPEAGEVEAPQAADDQTQRGATEAEGAPEGGGQAPEATSPAKTTSMRARPRRGRSGAQGTPRPPRQPSDMAGDELLENPYRR